MKENYLHDKIRKLDDDVRVMKGQLENIESNEELLSKQEKRMKEMVKDVFRETHKASEDYIDNCMDEYWKKFWQQGYNKLHFKIGDELKDSIKSINTYVKLFCEEVVLQRKDLGIIMSLLFKTKIITSEELIKMDRAIRQQMEIEGTVDDVFDSFKLKVIKIPEPKKAEPLNNLREK